MAARLALPKAPSGGTKDNEATFDARQRLHHVAGVDLTAIEGIEESTALVVLSEIGTDMSRWPSEKHCGSWLGLAPNLRKSGGKVKSSATRPGVNRAAQALRLAAKNLQRSRSAMGAFFRRIAARRGLAKAITATAYKLARIVYGLLKHGTAYVAQGLEAYETAYRERVVRQVQRKAMEVGLVVVEREAVAQPSRGGPETAGGKGWRKGRAPDEAATKQHAQGPARGPLSPQRSPASSVTGEGCSWEAGLIRCGRCGHRMQVRYGGTKNVPSYLCHCGAVDYGDALCQYVPSAPVDAFVSAWVLNALEPAALTLSLEATARVEHERQALDQLWQQRLERAAYETERAARHYRLVEPEHRLVARQLAQDWEDALTAQRQLHEEYQRFVQA